MWRFLTLAGLVMVATVLALLIVWRPLGRPGPHSHEASLRQLVLAASCGGLVFCLAYVGLIVQAMRAGLVD